MTIQLDPRSPFVSSGCEPPLPQTADLGLPPDASVEARLAAFAERHHGLVSSRAAGALGVTEHEVRRRFRNGRLDRVHPGIYRITGAPVTDAQRHLAALWWGWSHGSQAVVSHRSAARHWGIDLPVDPVIEISVDRPSAPRLEGVLIHRSLDLRDDHWKEQDGFRVTTPARTIVDLGAVVPWFLVDRALEIASSRRLVRIAEVQHLRETLSEHGRSGVGVIGEVLERRGLGEADSESILESAFAKLLRDHDIEGVVYQHEVVDGPRRRILDFAVPSLKLAFELKGYERHSQWGVFVDDCHRGAELSLQGWTVVEFTWDDVIRHPGYVLRVVLASIRLAAG